MSDSDIDLRAYWEMINQEYPEQMGLEDEETEEERPDEVYLG